MRLVRPLPLTLVDTSVAETTLAEWSVSTAYTQGNQVYYDPSAALVFHAFEALDAHTGQAPAVGGTTHWLDLGPVNNRAMFDDRTGTLTTDTTAIDVTVAPGAYFDQIALLGLVGVLSVQLVIVRGAVTLYDETFDLTEDAASWSDYFFGDRTAVRQSLSVQTPILYPDATVQAILTGATGQPLSCGLLMIGRGRGLGDTKLSPTVGIQDFSTKETDTWGNTYLLARAYADRAQVELVLESAQVDAVRRALAAVRASPCLYDLNNGGTAHESLTIFGFFETFDLVIAYATESYCRLTVQSLI